MNRHSDSPSSKVRVRKGPITLHLLFPAMVLIGCSSDDARQPQAAEQASRPIPVRTMELGSPTIESSLRTFTGVLKARRTVGIGAPISSEITEVPVKEGQWVKEGAVLVRLDTRRLLSAKSALQAQKQAAQATLDQLVAGPREETIRSAQATIRALDSELALAQQQLDRRILLLEADSTSQEDVDVGNAQVSALLAQLEGSKAQLDELENGTRPELIKNQAAIIEGIKAEDARIGIDVADSEVTAPFAGWVQSIYAHKGAVVPVGHDLIQLIEGSPFEAHFGLPVKDSVKLNGAEPTLTSGGTSLTIQEKRSLPMVDSTHRTITWIFDVHGPDSVRLRPGASAQLSLRYPLDKAGWRIPLSAITEGVRGMWAGYVAIEDEQGQWILQTVDLEILHTGSNDCVVHGALKAGDLLLVEGLDRVIQGQGVDPIGQASDLEMDGAK